MSIEVPTPERMRELAARVATQCRHGDVIVLDGGLGAGKTTFVQGLATALGIREPVTSPTFVIARTHRGGAMDLHHVDAYRVGSGLEFDDLDVDTDSGVTVVEWGLGTAERLAPDRLVIRIDHPDDGDVRTVSFEGIGSRWDATTIAGMERPW